MNTTSATEKDHGHEPSVVRDSSTCKFHYTTLVKFESQYVQQAKVTPWCPSGYLGYLLSELEFH
jgi:hypothetical protein